MKKLLGGDKKKNDNTFRPKKEHNTNSMKKLHLSAKASLGAGDLLSAVKLPPDEDLNEWLAVHVVDFYNTSNLIYGSLVSHCTVAACPVMNATSKFEYLWLDKSKDKNAKPMTVSAPQYVELLMDWIENQLNDESIFPTDTSVPFPKTFKKSCENIFKRLFRVYAHIYCKHFDHIKSMGEDAHLNTAFKHFMHFIFEFNLVTGDELAPLKTYILDLCGDKYADKFPKDK